MERGGGGVFGEGGDEVISAFSLLAVGYFLLDQLRDDSRASVGWTKPAAALRPVTAVVVDDLPLYVSGPTDCLMRCRIEK